MCGSPWMNEVCQAPFVHEDASFIASLSSIARLIPQSSSHSRYKSLREIKRLPCHSIITLATRLSYVCTVQYHPSSIIHQPPAAPTTLPQLSPPSPLPPLTHLPVKLSSPPPQPSPHPSYTIHNRHRRHNPRPRAQPAARRRSCHNRRSRRLAEAGCRRAGRGRCCRSLGWVGLVACLGWGKGRGRGERTVAAVVAVCGGRGGGVVVGAWEVVRGGLMEG